MPNKKMVIAVFRDHTQANRAFDALYRRGYTDSEINVLMSQNTHATYFTHTPEEKVTVSSKADEGMAIGGAIGTAAGATIAALLAVGTSLVIPGLGIVVAGPLAAALAGAGAGAVTGGLLGALVGWGIPESNAAAYEKALKEGGVVIGVVPHSSDDADAIQKEFRDLGGENVCYC